MDGPFRHNSGVGSSFVLGPFLSVCKLSSAKCVHSGAPILSRLPRTPDLIFPNREGRRMAACLGRQRIFKPARYMLGKQNRKFVGSNAVLSCTTDRHSTPKDSNSGLTALDSTGQSAKCQLQLNVIRPPFLIDRFLCPTAILRVLPQKSWRVVQSVACPSTYSRSAAFTSVW